MEEFITAKGIDALIEERKLELAEEEILKYFSKQIKEKTNDNNLITAWETYKNELSIDV